MTRRRQRIRCEEGSTGLDSSEWSTRLLRLLWSVFVALLILTVEQKMLGILPGIASLLERVESMASRPTIFALAMGILFGLMSCPVCAVGLAAYSSGAEGRVLPSLLAVVFFNLGRFAVFAVLGVIGGLLGEAFLERGLGRFLPFITAATGLLLLVLAMNLAGVIDPGLFLNRRLLRHLRAMRGLSRFSPQHPLEYLVWGGLLGFVCTMEGAVFIAAVWLSAVGGGLAAAVWAMVLFAVGAFIPPAVVVAAGAGSAELLVRHFGLRFMQAVRWTGAVLLLFMGLRYIIFGITNAQALLVKVP